MSAVHLIYFTKTYIIIKISSASCCKLGAHYTKKWIFDRFTIPKILDFLIYFARVQSEYQQAQLSRAWRFPIRPIPISSTPRCYLFIVSKVLTEFAPFSLVLQYKAYLTTATSTVSLQT